MRASRLLPALAAGSLIVAACGGSSGDSSANEPAPAAGSAAPVVDSEPATADADAPTGDVAAVPAALQFTAPLVGGGEIDAATLAGKPTLFWFWAPT